MSIDENRWYLIRDFFRARESFQSLFRRYEERVLRLSREQKVDRADLRIGWEELRDLIGFRALEHLQANELAPLKDVSHRLFRTPDATDKFDTIASQIYHEISILKEEHYALKEDHLAYDEAAYGRLFAEVSVYYPKRLRHIRGLFLKARRRLERLLPTLVDGRIAIRSVYLFSEKLFKRAYRDGLDGFYRKAYPEGGVVRGYVDASVAFRAGGFVELADEALGHARRGLAEARTNGAEVPDEVIGVLIREIADRDDAGRVSSA